MARFDAALPDRDQADVAPPPTRGLEAARALIGTADRVPVETDTAKSGAATEDTGILSGHCSEEDLRKLFPGKDLHFMSLKGVPYIIKRMEETKDGERQEYCFEPRSVGDMFALTPAEPEWLVEGMLTAHGTSLMASEPRAGKTTTAKTLSVCAALGAPFLGLETPSEGTCSLLFLHEEDYAQTVAWYRKAVEPLESGQQEKVGTRVFVHHGPIRNPKAALEHLAYTIRGFELGLVVLDTLQHWAGIRDITNYSEVAEILRELGDVAQAEGCHIMVTGHTRKQAAEGLVMNTFDEVLGSRAMGGGTDTTIVIRRGRGRGEGGDGDLRTFATSQRYGATEKLSLSLDPDSGMVIRKGTVLETTIQSRRDRILGQLVEGEPTTIGELKRAFGVSGESSRWVGRTLRALREDELVLRSGSGKRSDPYGYALVPAPKAQS